MSLYSVIFEGKISNGSQLQEVKRNLAALFKIDDQKADLLFTKPQVVLKKGLDYDSAVKYRKVLLNTGAVCNVKADAGPSDNFQVEKATPAGTTVQALKQSVPPPVSNQSSNYLTEDTAHLELEQSDESSSESTSRKGIGDIITGVVLIGTGFAFGGSVFFGNPGPLDYLFDGLGIFWIGRGVYKMVR
ncbi:hypothetical protein D1BOALGB6SA_4144 [Olavius sp. associated proteobacterium Delta 1]|nr:hypothetical protein D1BOALGB6SA_4144 [Olavius sp. associated proteobacterium Delta 1]